jgi:hypothetical protein
MKHRILSMILTGFCCCATAAYAQGDSLPQDEIGVFTAVVGTVTVAHPGAARVQPVKLHDEVLFQDVIETHNESRTKAFFEDDSVLTVGENSRVEITEHVYNPDQNHRRMVVNLLQGKLRALVSKVFKGVGSKFEIHTPTAVAAARGTYFVVWTEHDTTGIVNIGESGRVDFTAGGITVTVAPGEYSVVGPEGLPTPPAIYNAGSKESKENGSPALVADNSMSQNTTEATLPPQPEGTPQAVSGNSGETTSSTVRTAAGLVDQSLDRLVHVVQAIEGTVLKDMPKPESAIEIVRAVLPVLPISTTAVTGTVTTIAGTTSSALGQIIPEASSTPDGSATPVASVTSSLTSPLTSAVSSTLAPVASALTSLTSALTPLTSLVSTVVAPVTPIVTTVLSPVTPVVSGVVGPVTPVVSAVVAPVMPVVSVAPVAPVAAVIAPVLAPVTSVIPILPPAPSITPPAPVAPILPVTPPAVVSGITGALGLPIK